ncbi:hypothetical protein H5J25_12055 [Sphingomonas aliaeris]|uniref:Uncharacterized protein n=1 Tax=Sphingomonas aliaeris TaxID=2759526 RepID=A0A974S3B3_9SPHN|nr:hypothetical protein [Sphingomonas aliaeris]QQV76241.1 hypothetical protein H5J25_12055 [Sphingomonas aliaeris]
MFGLMIVLAAAQSAAPAYPPAGISRNRAAETKVVCKSEKIVGSTIPRRVCRNVPQDSTEARLSQEALGSQKEYARAGRN